MKNINEINLKSKKYIIFDLDGTLIDSIGVWNNADKKLILNHSNKNIAENIIMDDRHKFLENNQNSDIYVAYCKFLIEKYKFDIKDEYEISKERTELANKILAKEIDFKEGSVDLIKILKGMGLKVILATITTKEQLNVYCNINEKMIKQMSINDTFDSIFTKDDVEHKKPNPEIYLKVLEKYNAKPNECIVFEDSLHGVMASISAGIETINIYDKYSDCDREKINELTDYSIKDYDEFLKIIS